MNQIKSRRAVIGKAAGLIAGAGAGSMLGSTGQYGAQEESFRSYPEPLEAGREYVMPFKGNDSLTAPINKQPPSQEELRRWNKIESLRLKKREHAGTRHLWNVCLSPGGVDYDLQALRSTTPYWKACVMIDRIKKHQTAQQQLENKIDELRNAPNHLVDKLINSFLEEIEE